MNLSKIYNYLTDDETDTERVGLEIDEALSLLANPRRRAAIRAVADGDISRDDPTSVGALADTLAREEYGPDYDGQQRKRVYVSLYQTHLGTLDDADAVAYDQERGTVAPGEHIDGLRDLIDEATTRCDPTPGDQRAVADGGEQA